MPQFKIIFQDLLHGLKKIKDSRSTWSVFDLHSDRASPSKQVTSFYLLCKVTLVIAAGRRLQCRTVWNLCPVLGDRGTGRRRTARSPQPLLVAIQRVQCSLKQTPAALWHQVRRQFAWPRILYTRIKRPTPTVKSNTTRKPAIIVKCLLFCTTPPVHIY
jgi:hypothetical protein